MPRSGNNRSSESIVTTNALSPSEGLEGCPTKNKKAARQTGGFLFGFEIKLCRLGANPSLAPRSKQRLVRHVDKQLPKPRRPLIRPVNPPIQH